jgi:hypothetical protein
MSMLLRPLLWLATAGFAVSAVAHVLSFLGRDVTGGRSPLSTPLMVGLLVVFGAACLVASSEARFAPAQDFWKAALRGCPDWMRRGFYALFGYFLLNVAVSLATERWSRPGLWPPAGSAGLMVFYAIAVAVLYSRLAAGPIRPGRCAGGHEVPPPARFCPACGRPVTPTDGVP